MFTLNPPSWIAVVLLATGSAAAWAEKADRGRPMTLESDQPCTVSLLKQTSVCSGNVVISQGTLQLRADRLELRETPEGYQMAVATGSAAKPATYRQKRDGADEVVEGQAQRIDYDSRAGTLRFEGAAVVRRLRGSTVADEIQGQQIVWDSTAESFNVRGGAATATNPGGRVRAVITPRAPADAVSTAPAGNELKPSPGLGERR
jgi:lipopolysaccharide export system protein LptA